MKKKILALIPARGGSKSVYKKNIKLLGDHPLIAYSIEICKQCPNIDRFIVSTDDQEIADIALTYGAEVPFLRPVEFARDDSPDKPVFVHALDWLKNNENYIPDFVLHLRPTSPFRTQDDIKAVIKIWEGSECDSVRSVSLVDGISHPYWAYVERDGYGEHYITDPKIQSKYRSRQSLPPVYKAHGLVDGYTPESIYNSDDMLGDKLILYKVPSAIDIDTEDDFKYAEFLLDRKKVEGL